MVITGKPRASLGRVTPLGSISIQEWRSMSFLESKWPNDLEGQGQWTPFSITTERIPRCIFGANWAILAQICYKLSLRQDKFPRILSQNGQHDLEGQGQRPPFCIPAESIPRCMFGANLVILSQICDELLCGQDKVYGRTDGETDGQMQATTISLQPERVKFTHYRLFLIISGPPHAIIGPMLTQISVIIWYHQGTVYCEFSQVRPALPCMLLTHWGRDKWTPFRSRHFEVHFLEWKCLNSD